MTKSKKQKIWRFKEFFKLPKEKQNGKFRFEGGDIFWYKEGECHREDGPAIERYDGTKCWFKEGKLHREDGPAVELANGERQYYLKYKQYSYTEWYTIVNKLEIFL